MRDTKSLMIEEKLINQDDINRPKNMKAMKN